MVLVLIEVEEVSWVSVGLLVLIEDRPFWSSLNLRQPLYDAG